MTRACRFEAQFGLSWSDALAGGRVFNALDGCAALGITADELDAEWGKAKKVGYIHTDTLLSLSLSFFLTHCHSTS